MPQPPNFKSPVDLKKWMEGKATRDYVAESCREVEDHVSEVFDVVKNELVNSSRNIQTLFGILQSQGLQIDAMINLITKAIPEFRENFKNEYNILTQYLTFIETFNGNGENSARPLPEKIEMWRDWNNTHEKKINGVHVGLADAIVTNPQDFTPMEVSAFCEEFLLPDKVKEAHDNLYKPTLELVR